MKDILRDKGLPEELAFLPLIESGFYLNAYSRARAVGPWQFIASTAKRYGLVIDWWRDERKDPVKSTHAAAEYLRDLYRMFGSWKLALAAYNAGEGRIQRALKRTGAEDYWSLLNTRQIRNETKEYVPRYIAATMIANAPEDYGFYNLVYHEPLEYDKVSISSPVDVDVIARCAEVTVEDIRRLNPELRRWSTPPNVQSYTIRIPQGSTEVFVENLEKIPVEERFSVDTYKVKKGDNLRKIAKKTGIPVNVILAMNSMAGIERLEIGEDIKIPPKGKYYADIDDRMALKKASYKKKASDKKQTVKNKTSKKASKKNNKSKVKTKKI
jgi:membrane-bound lytic murein transglycosylase D